MEHIKHKQHIKVKQTFEESICVYKLEENNEELKEVIYTRGDEMKSSTNIKALMTHYMTFDAPFKKLGDDILKCLPDFCNKSSDTNDLYHKSQPHIENMWGAIYKGNGVDHTVPHRHLPFFCAFCYYVEAPTNCAPLVFPNTFGKYKIHPEQGDLIMFPAYLMHSVPKAVHDGERIIIAGNIRLQ